MARIAEAFADAVSAIIDQTAVSQDQTIAATIVSIVNVDKGEYKVSYQSNIFSAFSQNASTTYKEGDQVYVLVPNGDFEESKKIILMLVSDNKSYDDELTEVNYYIPQGPEILNLYSKNPGTGGGICACPQNKASTLRPTSSSASADYSNTFFDRTKGEAAAKAADEKMVQYAELYDYIQLSAYFHTTFSAVHSTGNYGITVIYSVSNPKYKEGGTESKYIQNSITLDISNFSGNPYQYGDYVKQTAYFEVKKGTIKTIDKVQLLQDGNFIYDYTVAYDNGVIKQTNITNVNNILCKDITFYFAKKVNLNDGYYHTWISTPEGNYVSKTTGSVRLVPHFYYKNVDYIGDCEVRWFRRRSDVTKQTPTSENKDKYNHVWTDYTGPGWEPIENIKQAPDGTFWHKAPPDGDTTKQQLQVFLAAVTWRWDYRCLCIYKENVQTGIADVTITNNDSEYDLFIGDTTTKNGQRKLYINDNKHDVTKADLGRDASGKTLYRHWFGKWYLYLPDQQYIPLTQNGQTLLEGPVDITDYLTESILTVRVQCYDPYIVNPDNDSNFKDLNAIGEIEYQIVNNEENAVGYWEGDKAFNYDADGKAKNSLHLNDCSVSLRISFPDVEGTAGGGTYHIDFYAPDGEEIYAFDDYDSSSSDGQTYDPENSMIKEMYCDLNSNTVHFKVKETYDGSLVKNTIRAQVNYYRTNVVYTLDCPITFSKDGEQGTNGTDWMAPIFPCNVSPRITNDNTEEASLLKEIKTAFNNTTKFDNFLQVTSTITFKGDNGKRVPSWTNYETEIVAAIGTTLTDAQTTKCKSYWTWRTDQYVKADPNTIVPKYSIRDELPHPLILKPNSAGQWCEVTEFPLCIRPFVSKNGVNIEEMNPYEGYFYKVWWDVRFDSTHTVLPYSSLLLLYHIDNSSGFLWDGNDATSRYYELGNASPGTCKYWESTGTKYLEKGSGLIGFNAYPSKNMIGTANAALPESYGAVRIRWAFARNNCGAFKLEDVHYIAFVKARIEIYKGGYDDTIGGINPGKTDAELVSTITSWYPVDLFFNSGNITFDRTMLKMNWPSYVIYNSYGENPVLNISNNGSADLFAFYSDTGYTSDSYDLYKKNMNMKAINNVTALADLVESTKSLAANNEDVETDSKTDFKIQQYKPRESLDWQHGLIGSLMTSPGTALDENGNDQWKGGFYVRSQIFTLNTYGNTQINGWDGESIQAKDGCIFAPTIGAGYKDKATNSFSGVIMGVDSQWKKKDLSSYTQKVHGYDEADMAAHPYLAGLYGYQRGASSFGLMENGTAFFGRADRGGRIIIDGYHATMYGGANGWTDHPKYNDPMWNTMRLNFVDLNHSTDSESTGGATLGFDGNFFEDSDFPDWLKKSWRRAYVVKEGGSATVQPYWNVIKNANTGEKYTYEDLIAGDVWYGGDEALDRGQGWKPDRTSGIYSKDGEWSKLTVENNVAINYWDNTPNENGDSDTQVWRVLDLQQWLCQKIGLPSTSTTATEEEKEFRRRYCIQVEYNTATINLALLTAQKDTERYAKDTAYKQDYDAKFLALQNEQRAGLKKIQERLLDCAFYDTGKRESPTETAKSIKNTDVETYVLDYLLDALDCANEYSSSVYPDADARKAIIAKELFNCSSWSEMIRNVRGDYTHYFVKADYQWLTNNCRITHQHSVFGPSRAATTPAIEIGQHVPGLRPGRLGISDFDNVMSNLQIPGDRNFMVTYDGTMWAMNGIFMGNVVGSNIIGGSLIGGEIEIGEIKNGASYYAVDPSCDWNKLVAPKQEKKSLDISARIVMKNGVIDAEHINVYGGNIDIGGFHIIGQDRDKVDKLSDATDDEGHLVQFGESDFVGPTHIYGNIGIGPNLNDTALVDNGKYRSSNYGNLFQTYGRVGLGVVMPNNASDGNKFRFHNLVAGTQGAMAKNNSNIEYRSGAKATGYNSPYILDSVPSSSWTIQDIAVFGIDTQSTAKVADAKYQGHFWPMAFKVRNGKYAVLTSMNNFLQINDDTIVDGSGTKMITNYFRVGNWGVECNEVFFRYGAKGEDDFLDSSKPQPDVDDSNDPVFGFVGLRSMTKWLDTMWGHSESHKVALGLESWNRYHIVIKSDMDMYSSVRGCFRVYADAADDDSDSQDTWYDDIDPYGACLLVGNYEEYGPGLGSKVHSLGGSVSHGRISFVSRTDYGLGGVGATGYIGGHGHPPSAAGIEINPENIAENIFIEQTTSSGGNPTDPGGMAGVFLYTKAYAGTSNDIHIVRYAAANLSCSSAENDDEIWIGENRTCVFHHTEVRIQVDGSSAHLDGTHFISMTPATLTFQGWTAEQQVGIYARFA